LDRNYEFCFEIPKKEAEKLPKTFLLEKDAKLIKSSDMEQFDLLFSTKTAVLEYATGFIEEYGSMYGKMMILHGYGKQVFKADRALADNFSRKDLIGYRKVAFLAEAYSAEGQQMIAAMAAEARQTEPNLGDVEREFVATMLRFNKLSQKEFGSVGYIRSGFNQWWNFLSEYPWLKAVFQGALCYTGFLGILAIIAKIFGLEDPGATTEGEGVVDHSHSGLVLGRFAKHKHECETCGAVFEHGHVIKLETISRTYGEHLCKKCKKEKTNKVMYNLPELVSSGDPRVVKVQNPRVEVISSGDPNVVRIQTPKVEVISSGDPTTVRAPRTRVEHDYNVIPGLKGKKIEAQDEAPKGVGMLESLASFFHPKNEYAAQMRIDENGYEIQKRVVGNCYEISLVKPTGKGYTVRGVFLRNRYFLTVSHLLFAAQPEDELVIRKNGMTVPYRISMKDVEFSQVISKNMRQDLVVIKLPRQVADHPDIIKFVAGRQDHADLSRFKGLLVFNGSSEVKRFSYGDVKRIDRELYYANEAKQKFIAINAYEYSMETSTGDCGAPLFVISSKANKKMVGLHVAGGTGTGYSTPLILEDIQMSLEALDVSAQGQQWITFPDMTAFVDEERFDETVPDGEFFPIGKAIAVPGVASTTKLRQSIIHDQLPWTNKTIPAYLKPTVVDGQLLDPMAIGLKKAGVPCVKIPQDLVAIAANDMCNMLRQKRRHARVLSELEMIQGVDGEQFLPAIRRSTSAGYPWSMDSEGKPGKTKWLGTDEFTYHQELKAAVDQRENLARHGERMACIWVDTLKDERRPIAKVRAGKTRVFSAGPMDYTLLFRKYFLGLCATVEENRIDNEICVGTNVYSIDWQRIYNKITRFGEETIVAGDFSNYDGTLQIDILEEMIHIINKWYDDGEENALIRQVLWRDIINSIHLWGDNIYAWTHSQPSGCPMTAVLNSIYNSLSVRVVYLILARQVSEKLANMEQFHRYVSMVSYGDDNLIGISPIIIDWFNQITLAEAYSQIGMTYTDESKSGELVPCRNIREVSFLKRKFLYESAVGREIAPLAEDTITEMVLWIRSDVDVISRCIDNCTMALFEASLHGQRYYEWFAESLIRAAEAVEMPLRVPTWYEQISSILAGHASLTSEAVAEMSQLETWALDEDEIAERVSWLDPSEGMEIDVNSDQQDFVGGLFSLDDGKPPTQIMGSHPACTRADMVLEAQGKVTWTNNNEQTKTDGQTMDKLTNPMADLHLENPDVATMGQPEKEIDNTLDELVGDPLCEAAKKILEKPRVHTVVLNDLNSYTDEITIEEWRLDPQTQGVLKYFSHFRGTFCVRIECYNDATEACTTLCEWTNEANYTRGVFARGDFTILDNNGPSIVTLKKQFPLNKDFVSTGQVVDSVNNLLLALIGMNIHSVTTGAEIKLKVAVWMEDVNLRLPKAQGRVETSPFIGSGPSLEHFSRVIGEDGIERLLTDPTYVQSYNYVKTQNQGDVVASFNSLSSLFDNDAQPQKAFLDVTDRMAYGEVELLFWAIKTTFHRGKLWLSLGRDADASRGNTGVMWDLGESNKFKVRIPWTNVDRMNHFLFTYEEDPFYFDMRVDTPLTGPASVSDGISILCFASMHNTRIGTIYGNAVTQGLVGEVDCPSYQFPNKSSQRPSDGRTLRETLEEMTGPPRVFKPADLTTGQNFVLTPSFGEHFGYTSLMKFFGFWAGTLEYEVMPTGSVMPYTGVDGTPSAYLFTPQVPKNMVVCKGENGTLDSSSFLGPLSTHDGYSQITSTDGGIQIVMHPENTVATIVKGSNYRNNVGSIMIGTLDSKHVLDGVVTKLKIGKDFKAGFRC
jgi:hypothetical protein